LHGGSELIHLKTWRMGSTLLQASEAAREVRMECGVWSSFVAAQGFPVQAIGPHGSSQIGEVTLRGVVRWWKSASAN
jgi:hypothetical protein